LAAIQFHTRIIGRGADPSVSLATQQTWTQLLATAVACWAGGPHGH